MRAVASTTVTSSPLKARDQALACFSFPSLADYEVFRTGFGVDPEYAAADRMRDESECVLRWERTFMRPVLP
jgi:hypothetical protein